MIIVGITGSIGHGKTTLAEFLAGQTARHRHWESSDVVIEVANTLRHESSGHPAAGDIAGINAWLAPLSDIITACVHCPADFSQLALSETRLAAAPDEYRKLFDYLRQMADRPELQAMEISQANKQQFRSLLQWLGGYLVKHVNRGVWYDELVRRLRRAEASGVQLATVGGVRFPGDAERLRNAGGFIIAIERPGQEVPDAHDATERERQLITPDTTVINDGSLQQLRALAADLYRDLELRQLRPRYQASR